MKIISCHIEGFGKLVNERMEFTPGCNVIRMDNGSGKSTLAAFLKAMFYGLSGDRERKPEKKERERYRPWSGGVFGGEVCFSVGENVYRLNRTFGEKPAGDRYVLRDFDTNAEIEDLGPRIGEALFRMDAESFERTVFLAQKNCNTELNDEMSRLLGKEDTEHGGIQADEILNELMNHYSPTRQTGSIKRLENQRTEISNELRNVSEFNRQKDLITEESKKLSERVKELQDKKSELQESILKAQREIEEQSRDIEERNHRAMVHQAEVRLREAMAAFPGEAPTEEAMDAIRRDYAGILYAKEQLTPERVYPKLEKENATLFGVGSGILGLLALVLLILQPDFGEVLGIPVWGLLAVLLFGGMIGGLVFFRKEYRIKKKNAALSAEIIAHWTTRNKELDGIRRMEEHLQIALSRYQMGDMDISDAVEQLGSMSDTLLMRQFQLKEVMEEGSGAASEPRVYEHTSQELAEMISNWNQVYRETEAELSRMQSELEHCERNLRSVEQKLESLDEREVDRKRIEEQLEQERITYHRLEKTREYLKKARENQALRYTKPILVHFKDYYEKITGEGKEFYMDSDAKLSVKQQGLPRATVYESEGYRDLIGFAERIAISDVMFPEEKPFLVLDDPFVNLDEGKLQCAEQLLTEIATRYQVFYFTARETGLSNT